MEDVETIPLTPEPTERPKEVCREETVSSSEPIGEADSLRSVGTSLGAAVG